MNLIENIRNLFKPKKKEKHWSLAEGHVVVPAFIDRGVQYYEIKDLFNTFSNRGMMALQVYEEWDMRLKKEDLQDFILSFEKTLGNPKEINILNLVKIVNMLKERVNFPIATADIYYKMASVRYFDENESPYTYDPEYNKGKIARWQEATSTVDPFYIAAASGYASFAQAIKGRFAQLFGNREEAKRPSITDPAIARLASAAEHGFLQRIMINQRYGIDCNRLTLWEYLLLIEHTKQSE